MVRSIQTLVAAGALATAMALSATPALSQQVTLKLWAKVWMSTSFLAE